MTYLPQLKTFVEVHRLGSITAAAAALNMTQPGATAHIKILENKFGKLLFTRQARGVTPTAFADDLAAKIAPQIYQIEDTIDDLSLNVDALKGDIYVGGPVAFISAQLLGTFASLSSYQIQTHFSFGGKSRIYELLENQEIDFAITASKIESAQLKFELLQQEKLILVAGADFVKHNSINKLTLNALLKKPFIAYDTDLPLIRDYFSLDSSQISAIKPVIAVPDLRSILDLVIKNVGVSVLPEYLCISAIKKKEIVELTKLGKPYFQSLFLVTHNKARLSQRIKFVKQFILDSLK